jgi:hypothetical protein
MLHAFSDLVSGTLPRTAAVLPQMCRRIDAGLLHACQGISHGEKYLRRVSKCSSQCLIFITTIATLYVEKQAILFHLKEKGPGLWASPPHGGNMPQMCRKIAADVPQDCRRFDAGLPQQYEIQVAHFSLYN